MQCKNHSYIYTCCKEKIPRAYGFKWRYYEGEPLDYDAPDDVTGFTPVEELLRLKMTGGSTEEADGDGDGDGDGMEGRRGE